MWKLTEILTLIVKRHLVFEELQPVHRWVLIVHFFIKKKVYYIRVNQHCYDQAWFQWYIKRKFLLKHPVNQTDLFQSMELGYDYDTAYDSIDLLFEYFKFHPIIKYFQRLYAHPSISLIFKKGIHRSLSRFYYLNTLMQKISSFHPQEKIYFVPSCGTDRTKTDGCDGMDYLFWSSMQSSFPCYFPFWVKISSWVFHLKRKGRFWISLLGFVPWCLFQCVRNGLNTETVKSTFFKYGVIIIAPFRQFANPTQKIDYLIDHQRIKKEEVLFISVVPLTGSEKRYLQAHSLKAVANLNQFICWKDVKIIL